MTTFTVRQIVTHEKSGLTGEIQHIWHNFMLGTMLRVYVESTGTTYDWSANSCTPDLKSRQSAFIAAMVASGKDWSDLTPAERAEAARLGFCRRLPVVAAPRPMPANVTYTQFEKSWW